MIDYEAIGKAGGISKGDRRKKVKARKARADAKWLKAFRDDVWKRERIAVDGEWEVAHCQSCAFLVFRSRQFRSADVHHVIGRRNKATRYDPDNGVLLCNHLVNDCHGKAQRKEIQV